VLLRADMNALLVTEATGLAYGGLRGIRLGADDAARGRWARVATVGARRPGRDGRGHGAAAADARLARGGRHDIAVVTVGALNAGTKANIIPDSAELLLNIRSYDETVRAHLLDGIGRVVDPATEWLPA
jgi:acetylornithine deacetylase/succinyl-diaminopimelate desuccinylase-like protein